MKVISGICVLGTDRWAHRVHGALWWQAHVSGGGRILRLGIPGIKCVDTKYINNVNFNVVYIIL